MLLTFGIVFIVAALAMTPIRFRALGFVGLVPEAFCCLSVRLGRLPVLTAVVSVRRGELILTRKSGRRSPLKLTGGRGDPNSLAAHLDNGILRIVDLRRVEVYATAGVADNAFAGAMLAGGIRAALGAGLAGVRARWTGLSALDYVETHYGTDVLELSLTALAALSAVEFGYGIGAAVARKWKTARRKDEPLASVG